MAKIGCESVAVEGKVDGLEVNEGLVMAEGRQHSAKTWTWTWRVLVDNGHDSGASSCDIAKADSRQGSHEDPGVSTSAADGMGIYDLETSGASNHTDGPRGGLHPLHGHHGHVRDSYDPTPQSSHRMSPGHFVTIHLFHWNFSGVKCSPR